MPEICRFLGISIRMYFNDHASPHWAELHREELLANWHDLQTSFTFRKIDPLV